MRPIDIDVVKMPPNSLLVCTVLYVVRSIHFWSNAYTLFKQASTLPTLPTVPAFTTWQDVFASQIKRESPNMFLC